ncbi:TerB family tellurite resistance protein [Pseudochryseolinea flava]|uniref:TerB family tellurite resistance protein n=1 Tax=Pseudochryseolinea flava TaxID=2059302 RepID=A0A364XUL3_9BACT|nr:TerB family tellurite resistance protein [Pseudochryseolinea flava]RAV97643.1 TerB family tellurite resistance protein [Pseudochryseolinea flava]
MRQTILIAIMLCVLTAANAQTQEATQLILNYEKLKQLEEILDNMYKGYKILTKGYNRIKDIAEGNFNLHQVFLDGLFAVNPSVAKYKRIPDIIRYQSMLIKEYKRAFDRFKCDPKLTPDEIKYLERVYSYLAKQSLRNLEELTMIVTANKLRMSDDERIQSIDRIYFDMESKLSFLRYFNNSTQVLVVQRAKESSEVGGMEKLYEVEN